MKRVLIITRAARSRANLQVTRGFVAALNEDANDATFAGCAIQDLLFSAHDGQISVTYNGAELHTQCDVIHLRNTHLFPDYANALRLYADHFGIEMINRNDARLPYYGKLSQGFLLAADGINTPSFISSYSNDTLLEALPDSGLGFPVVIKHNNGTKGNDNYLVHSLEEARSILTEDKEEFMAQQFIANSGELRVLRFGADVEPIIFKKQAPEGEYLNNTSRGGISTPMAAADVSADILHQAHRASELMGRAIAGVDVLLGNDGQFYILEVNTTPAIASGALLEDKRKRYLTFFEQSEKAVEGAKLPTLYIIVKQEHTDKDDHGTVPSLLRACERIGMPCKQIIVGDINLADIGNMQFAPGSLLYRVSTSVKASIVESMLVTLHPGTFTTIYYPQTTSVANRTYLELCMQTATGLRIIPTLVVDETWQQMDITALEKRAAELDGFPLVVKELGLSHGQGVRKVETAEELQGQLQNIDFEKYGTIVRKYLAEYRHYRIIVVDGKAIAAIEYHKPANDFRTNASTPDVSPITLTDLPSDVVKLSLDGVALRSSILGGVDVLVDQSTQTAYLAEVNVPCYYPRAEGVTDIDVSGELIAALLRKRKKEQS